MDGRSRVAQCLNWKMRNVSCKSTLCGTLWPHSQNQCLRGQLLLKHKHMTHDNRGVSCWNWIQVTGPMVLVKIQRPACVPMHRGVSSCPGDPKPFCQPSLPINYGYIYIIGLQRREMPPEEFPQLEFISAIYLGYIQLNKFVSVPCFLGPDAYQQKVSPYYRKLNTHVLR